MPRNTTGESRKKCRDFLNLFIHCVFLLPTPPSTSSICHSFSVVVAPFGKVFFLKDLMYMYVWSIMEKEYKMQIEAYLESNKQTWSLSEVSCTGSDVGFFSIETRFFPKLFPREKWDFCVASFFILLEYMLI